MLQSIFGILLVRTNGQSNCMVTEPIGTGQPKFRSTWERYCNGVDAIVFVTIFYQYE